MCKGKILLIGPLPPPPGGVSIHIQRLSNVLKSAFDVDFIDEAKSVKNGFYNIRSFKLWGYFKKIRQAKLLYIHSGTSFLRMLHLTVGWVFSKKIILTLHFYPPRKSKLLRYIDELFYRFADAVIVVNSNILQNISLPSDKYIVNNAFLPPVMDEEPQLPSNVTEWISNEKKSQKIVICANAWRLDTFNNHDLYGLDLCIEITRRLLAENRKVSFVFNVATIDNFTNVYEKYQSLIQELDLQHNFLLINQNLSFVRLIEQADIVLRPTNWDGDSLTVREALMLGKHILASDIVERPTGTALFKTRDIADLEIKLKHLLNVSSAENPIQANGDKNSYADFYIDLTRRLLGCSCAEYDNSVKIYQEGRVS